MKDRARALYKMMHTMLRGAREAQSHAEVLSDMRRSHATIC